MRVQPAVDYSPMARRVRPLMATIWGFVAGTVALGIWIITFQPHGGPEFSWFLFPVARVVLDHIYPNQSIPVVAWYGSALLQWVLIGACVDVVGLLRRRRRN